MWRRIRATTAPRATILVRLVAGMVFLTEGIQKFLYPAELGAGRFAKIGLPAPDLLAPFVGVVEIVGGAFILLGLLTRVAALALLINISVALVTTKLPILFGHALGPFTLAPLKHYGFWAMAHEARTDWSMLFASLFLLLVGAGPWSLDARLDRTEGKIENGG